MPQDSEDILDGTVSEVKEHVREMDEPDYRDLLEKEKDGKDRKTVKEFLESRMDTEEEEPEDTSEDTEEVDEMEEVEEIERETAGGLLGGYSRTSVLTGGLLLGVVIGLLAGMGAGAMGVNNASPAQVQQSVHDIVTAGGFNGTADVSTPVVRNNMYFMNLTVEQQVGNQTVSQTQGLYASLDGDLLFPVQERFGQQISPINIPQALAASQNPDQEAAN